MKCPFCDNELQDGGLIISGRSAGWVPQEQFGNKGLKQLDHRGFRSIGEENVLFELIKLPGAYFCPQCRKVMGAFDLSSDID